MVRIKEIEVLGSCGEVRRFRITKVVNKDKPCLSCALRGSESCLCAFGSEQTCERFLNEDECFVEVTEETLGDISNELWHVANKASERGAWEPTQPLTLVKGMPLSAYLFDIANRINAAIKRGKEEGGSRG
jgi:hypothetical protein